MTPSANGFLIGLTIGIVCTAFGLGLVWALAGKREEIYHNGGPQLR